MDREFAVLVRPHPQVRPDEKGHAMCVPSVEVARRAARGEVLEGWGCLNECGRSVRG